MTGKQKTEPDQGSGPAQGEQGSGETIAETADAGPELAGPGTATAAPSCSICGGPAAFKTDGVSANEVLYCEADAPANAELTEL